MGLLGYIDNHADSEWASEYAFGASTLTRTAAANFPGSAGQGLRHTLDGGAAYKQTGTFGPLSHFAVGLWWRVVSFTTIEAESRLLSSLHTDGSASASAIYWKDFGDGNGAVLCAAAKTDAGTTYSSNRLSAEVGRWYHLMLLGHATADGAYAALYVDRQLIGSATRGEDATNRQANAWRIGSDYIGPFDQYAYDVDEIHLRDAEEIVPPERLSKGGIVHPGERSVIRRAMPVPL